MNPQPTRSGQRSLVTRLVLTGLCALCLAPTPGDIGGCGAPSSDLGARRFFAAKRATDCKHCRECSLATHQCAQSCQPGPDAGAAAFADNCFPLVHDGEVCLRALEVASCDDYRAFMSDDEPSVPTECNFCPAELEP